MAIDLRTVTGKAIDPATGKPLPRQKAPARTNSESPPQADAVSLTETVEKLRDASKALASGAVIDTELVARVADALNAGTYAVDAEQIAAKMIEMERQLPVEEMSNG